MNEMAPFVAIKNNSFKKSASILEIFDVSFYMRLHASFSKQTIFFAIFKVSITNFYFQSFGV